MPTISQLPAASEVSAADQLPISQSGSACAVSVGSLLANVQPAILAPTGTLLGRTSLGPGGPDPVSVGTGLALNTGTLAANGGDHTGFPRQGTLTLTDEAVLSSNGMPKLMALSLLRGIYLPGTNIAIDQNGTISATSTSSSYSISDLPTVSTISAGDLVAVSQGSTDHTITYANLIDGQTIEEIQGAAAASDSDWLLVAQGDGTLLRQSLTTIWTWLSNKLPNYLSPTVELTSNTALTTIAHNGHVLLCSQPVTITAASSNLGSGFTCSIINVSNGNVTLGSNIATSSGTSAVGPGQAAMLTCIAYSGGSLVYASVGSPAASSSPPAQVSGLTTVGATSNSIMLSWQALSPAPTSYGVQYRVTGSGAWSSVPSVTTTACTVIGLLAATSYDFVVSAVNGAGMGTPSTIVTAVT